MIRLSSLVSAFFIILESDAVPSQPLKTYVNLRSKVHAAKTLIIGYSLRPRYRGTFFFDTFTRTCVPSIAPTQF